MNLLIKKLKVDKYKKYKLINGNGIVNKDSDAIVLSTRSFLGVMYYLSHSVDVPDKDKTSGRVTITYDEYGNDFLQMINYLIENELSIFGESLLKNEYEVNKKFNIIQNLPEI